MCTGPIGGVIPVLADRRNRQSGGFFPAMHSSAVRAAKLGAVIRFLFFGCADNVAGVLNHFTGFGFLAALEIGVAEEVHGMRLVVGFGGVHFRGVSAGSVGGNIRGDGILPQTEADEDVGRHVYGVGGVRRDGRIAAVGFEALGREFGAVCGVNQIVRDGRGDRDAAERRGSRIESLS